MAEEKVFLDETFPIVKYNNTVPLAGLPLLKRREHAQVANVRVIVTDKRIVVDEKMTVLANIAAVSVGDDEREVAEHNAAREARIAAIAQLAMDAEKRKGQRQMGCGMVAAAVLGSIALSATDGGLYCVGIAVLAVLLGVGLIFMFGHTTSDDGVIPPELTPDYAVVIESAGTRDNALVSKDRMVVQKIVRAISEALLSR